MKKMFSEREIGKALKEYKMESVYWLNGDAKVMFYPNRDSYDVYLWCWVDESWVIHQQVRVARTGNEEMDKKYGIQLVMERAGCLPKIYKFYQDVKVVKTEREYYTIVADSLEDAREKVKGCCNLSDCDEAEFYDSETVISSSDDMYNFQNPNIIAIYDPDGEEVE
jgi:hypothetical protein